MLQRVDVVTKTLEDLVERVPTMATHEAVDTFGKLKVLEKFTKTLGDSLKTKLKASAKEGGLDSKGNTYLAGKEGGVKLENRYTPVLKEDAEFVLEDYLHLFPLEPKVALMESILKDLDVPAETYSVPALSVKNLEALIKDGDIPEDVGLAALDAKVVQAVKSVQNDAGGVS